MHNSATRWSVEVGQRRLISRRRNQHKYEWAAGSGRYRRMNIFWWVREHTSCVIHFGICDRFLDEDFPRYASIRPRVPHKRHLRLYNPQADYEYHWSFVREYYQWTFVKAAPIQVALTLGTFKLLFPSHHSSFLTLKGLNAYACIRGYHKTAMSTLQIAETELCTSPIIPFLPHPTSSSISPPRL